MIALNRLFLNLEVKQFGKNIYNAVDKESYVGNSSVEQQQRNFTFEHHEQQTTTATTKLAIDIYFFKLVMDEGSQIERLTIDLHLLEQK